MAGLKRCLAALFKELQKDALIYIALVAYAVVGALWTLHKGQFSTQPYILYFNKRVFACFFLYPFGACLVGLAIAVIQKPKQPLSHFLGMLTVQRAVRFIAGIVLIASMTFFQGTFALVKSVLPAGIGFPHDELFANIDRFLHFGIDPWRLTHAVASFDGARFLITNNYFLIWILCQLSFGFWMAISPKADGVRVRYFLSAMLMWIILGNIIAYYGMSAGPCYFAQVTGDHERFAELTAFINSANDSLSRSQAYLWQLYQTGTAGFGSGISAFPSLHVAAVTLTAFYMRELAPRFAPVAWLYVAIILFSSVYTGWHYAIDGYASLILVAILYYVCRFAARRIAAWQSVAEEDGFEPATAVSIVRNE